MNMAEPETADATQPVFYPVGLRKLALMLVATLGLYGLHWFYENWWLIKARRNAKFNPATRTFFAPLFAWALFREIRRIADEERFPTAYSPVGAAAVYLLGVLAAVVLIDDLWPVALLLLCIPIHLAQDLANKINAVRAPAAGRNDRLSGINRVALVLGGVVFSLALLASWASVREKFDDGVEQGVEADEAR